MTTEPKPSVLAGTAAPEAVHLEAGRAPVPVAEPAATAPATALATKAAKAASAKRVREQLVLLCMGLVTAASAATLYALLEFSLSSAVLCGGLIWAALMTVHVQFKKSAEIAQLKADLARLEGVRNGSLGYDAGGGPHAKNMAGGDADAAGKPRAAAPRRSVMTGAGAPVAPGAGTPMEPAPQMQRPMTGPQTSDAPDPAMGPQPHPRWEMPPGQQRAAKRRAADMGQQDPRAAAAGAHDPSRSVEPALETALWPGTALGASDPMRDHWAFRPKHATLVASEPGQSAGFESAGFENASRPGEDFAASAQPSASIDADLEMVQRKIKALADEVNAAEQMRDRQPAASMATQSPQPSGSHSASQTAALEKSIGALKSTAETMRERPMSQSASHSAPKSRKPATESLARDVPAQSVAATPPVAQPQSLPFDLMIPATAERIAVSDPNRGASAPLQTPAVHAEPQSGPHTGTAPQPILELPELPAFDFAPLSAPAPEPQPNPRLAAIIAAVESGEMDVFLSPIVALQSHQVSHYDVTVRVKNPAGAYLDDAEQELQLAGSDVLALFDTARLKRAAALAQRLDAHNKSGSLLSAVNGPSITNAEFLETFARVYEERDRISNQLVLTFSQADLEQFSVSAWQALSDMHAFGFRFALAKIDHVAMDFAALATRGFAFLRLDADALMNGLPGRERFMGPDELCKHLAGAGMTLVADTIDDEAIRARVFGFGILFGQGRLFGGARQVKLDALPAGSSAAA